MSEFAPVSEPEDLARLDEGEMIEGYIAGLHGESEPSSAHSRSYWHGWRNGRVDGGFAKLDEQQQKLAHALYGPSRRMGML